MLTNLWYVAEWADAVKDKPVRAKLLGQNFVLFRDKAGKVLGKKPINKLVRLVEMLEEPRT